jgi:hypothetical protein
MLASDTCLFDGCYESPHVLNGALSFVESTPLSTETQRKPLIYLSSIAMLDCVDCAMLKMSGERFTTFDFGDLRQSRLQK